MNKENLKLAKNKNLKRNIILGIHDGFDCSASIMINGKIVYLKVNLLVPQLDGVDLCLIMDQYGSTRIKIKINGISKKTTYLIF